MFSAIHEFLANVFDLDFLSSEPGYYFSDAWGAFKQIFSVMEDYFLDFKDTLSSK
ncbi:hypothetical protein [Corynebacterium silvaticum]|uniref:Uncharacterized protein n=1 Tax=Corynebacterium silvaticum TaxID=2320431 RepID=A0ACD4PY48_9CORY|nr:hypothetical protein [Corynebacterium silvaticum]MBH5300836.1 hypothetical protein [Corynebacterium silvaticum]NOM65033.1 hypothetical protein [Corynebacterium silvaticum]NON70086.1 hypothetical protein [Corynebacterium silvaticum]UWH00019.1 hypothetical protein K1I39_10250 [Corynebacterium silvaticum]UWH02066.1 hypothetical protein K1I38_10275 [Corynebacterium silvaticum]